MNFAAKAVACIAKATHPFLGYEIRTAFYFAFGGDHVGLQVDFLRASDFRVAPAPFKNAITLGPQHPCFSPDTLASEADNAKVCFFA